MVDKVIELNINEAVVFAEPKATVGHFSGRACALIAEGQKAVKNGVVKFFDATSRVCGNVEVLQQAAKFAMFSMAAKEVVTGRVANEKLMGALDNYDCFIDGTGVLRDAAYFTTNEHKADWKEGKKFTVLGRIAGFITDISGGIYWLASLGAVSLSNAAKAIGRIPLFGMVRNMSLLTFVKISATFTYGFIALASLQAILKGENVTKNALDLSFASCEIGLKALGFANISCPVGMVALGLGAAGSAVAGFLYAQYAKKDEEQKEIVKAICAAPCVALAIAA